MYFKILLSICALVATSNFIHIQATVLPKQRYLRSVEFEPTSTVGIISTVETPSDATNNINNTVEISFNNDESTLQKVKDYVNKKFRDLGSLLKVCKNRDEVLRAVKYDVDEVPQFVDPFQVEDMNEIHNLADYNATNIVVRGLSHFNDLAMDVDQKNKKAVITLKADELYVNGKYGFKNLIASTCNKFEIKLYQVVYKEELKYAVRDMEVDILESETRTKYDKSDKKIEGLPFLNKMFSGVIRDRIVKHTLKNVTQYMHYKMKHVAMNKLRSIHETTSKKPFGGENKKELDSVTSSAPAETTTHVYSRLEETFKNSIAEARPVVLSYPKFDLVGEDVNVSESGYEGSLNNIVIDPLTKFEIHSLDIPITNDKVQMKFEINVGSIVGTADVKVNGDINNQYSYTVNFTTDDLILGSILEKKLNDNSELFQLGSSSARLSTVKVTVPPSIEDSNLKLFYEHISGILKNIIVQRFLKLGEDAVSRTLSEQAITPRLSISTQK